MAMNDWSIIGRSLRTRGASTVITAATVGVAVAMLLVLLSMRDAGERAFSRGSGNAHLVVSRDSSPLTTVLNVIFYADPPGRFIEWREYERLANSAPFAWTIPTQQGDSYKGLPVVGTTGEFFTEFRPHERDPWRLTPRRRGDAADGRFFERPFEVVVGSRAAESTGLRVGDVIYLTHGIPRSRQSADPNAMEPHVHTEFAFTVVGVLEPTGSIHDRALFTDLVGSWVLHAHDRRVLEQPGVKTTTEADLLEEDRKITGVLLRVATRPGMMDATASLQPVFNQLRADQTITVAQPVQQITTLFNIVSNVDRILIAMAGVVLVSSAISILLALYNSMDQRRRQVAILRVLGCSRSRVFGLVLTESAIIGLMGAAAGVGLAYVGGRIAAGALQASIGLVVEPRLPVELVMACAMAAVLLAAVAGAIPAAMAYRTEVWRQLRPAA
ncbi:MAG: FtsX-like permease family protein [Phycisphaeraceae bacterium]|nr:FtsX-like permease family protein [Phycisphaeraceae bacterium]